MVQQIKETAGPDFSNGFGWLNLLRSVKMLENNNYFNTSVNSGATNTHTITIPPGASIAHLKVMLYWNDSAAAVLAASALVNDLDLEVSDPSALVHFPQLLNPTPANVTDTAKTGADHINNIEQVVIDNPVPGTYTFSVKGTTIPSGTQHEYFLVFDTIPVSTTVTYPSGGEYFQGGDAIYISWDSYGNPSNTFKLQYSLDNVTWIDVPGATNLAATTRQFNWTIPVAATNQARVKVIDNVTAIESIGEPFTIIGVPVAIIPSNQCEGYILVNWAAVTGATDYEVMMLRGDEMVTIATTAATTYTFKGLSSDSVYWISLRARINGKPGRRAIAASVQPNVGPCTGTISDKDLKIDAILSPVSSGRKFTSTELSNAATITIRIENLDNAPTSGDIPVTYIIDNNAPVTETIVAPAIAARGVYTYSFTTKADMSAVGSHD